jgi:hypothetical protein
MMRASRLSGPKGPNEGSTDDAVTRGSLVSPGAQSTPGEFPIARRAVSHSRVLSLRHSSKSDYVTAMSNEITAAPAEGANRLSPADRAHGCG